MFKKCLLNENILGLERTLDAMMPPQTYLGRGLPRDSAGYTYFTRVLPQSLQQDPDPYSPIPMHFGGALWTLQSECCLLSSAPMSPRWEAHLSRILSESQMRLLTISVVAASAMYSHGLHTRYVCVCADGGGTGGILSSADDTHSRMPFRRKL